MPHTTFRPRCPTCDMLAEPGISDPYLPFCSERCRLIDLGRWLNEEHAVTCDADPEDSESEGQPPQSGDRPRLPPGWHDA